MRVASEYFLSADVLPLVSRCATVRIYDHLVMRDEFKRLDEPFGGNVLTAAALPTTSGSGTPAISDWVSCSITGFSNGFDPHTVTAYESPNSSHAIAVLANGGATSVAVVDLTKMLDPTIVTRTAGGHGCAAGALPSSVVSMIRVP